MARGEKTLASDLNNLYTRLNAVRTKWSLNNYSDKDVAKNSLALSANMTQLALDLTQTSTESIFVATTTYTLDGIDKGSPMVYTSLSMVDPILVNFETTCVDYSNNSSDRSGYCADHSNNSHRSSYCSNYASNRSSNYSNNTSQYSSNHSDDSICPNNGSCSYNAVNSVNTSNWSGVYTNRDTANSGVWSTNVYHSNCPSYNTNKTSYYSDYNDHYYCISNAHYAVRSSYCSSDRSFSSSCSSNYNNYSQGSGCSANNSSNYSNKVANAPFSNK